ncbi:MAG TPA: MarP family serine protease [Candidatus Saccharimonadia bacterium]
MNFLDFVIVVLVLAVAARGIASGFLRQAGSLGGFVLGLMAGAVIAPWLGSAFPPGTSRSMVVLVVFFGVAIMIGGLGETLGYALSGLAERYRLTLLDAVLGAAFGIGVALFTVWMLAATFARSAGPALATDIQNSRILQSLDRDLPPAPDVLARFERALGVNNFPRVFTGLEPSPAPPVTGPNAAAVTAAANAGRAATVRIEGLGCGGLLEGSGFVAGPGLVATNAHVVAGIDQPVVVDANGSHRATVVFFDPSLDFAVLRTTNLAAAPLPLAGSLQSRGVVGAVLGYPGGGSFTVSPAAILSEQTALGRDIYDSGLTRRQIYTLQAVVRPGNSGGPLITPDGTVVGVVFAMSTTDGNIGYALTSNEILPDLNAAATNGPVSTGACASE